MGRAFEYQKTARNTVVRNGSTRGKYELELIHTLINNTPALNVAFSPSPEEEFPVSLPMIGVMGSYENPSAGVDEPLDCYLHGYVSARLNNLARHAHAAGKPGLPVCITATKVDGIILALSSFNHSYNYRSAVLYGYANIVTDQEEVLWAMKEITNKVVAGRWNNVRLPLNKAEISSTGILRVTVKSGSGKVRDGPPGDDKADKENADLLKRVWTGFVPLTETYGTPVPNSYNKVEAVPEYLSSYLNDYNSTIEDYSKEMVHRIGAGN